MTSARSILLKLLALALILLIQGPAVLVQQAAWVNMLVSYTRERGLTRGVIETFDGNHPCELCKAAESIRHRGGDRQEPGAPREARPNLAWGPMLIPAGRAGTPPPAWRQLPPPETAWRRPDAGRGRESPDTPPPEAA